MKALKMMVVGICMSILNCSGNTIYAECDTGSECDGSIATTWVCTMDGVYEEGDMLSIFITDPNTIRSTSAILEGCIDDKFSWDPGTGILTTWDYIDYSEIGDDVVVYHLDE
jgi:hypothetical protein